MFLQLDTWYRLILVDIELSSTNTQPLSLGHRSVISNKELGKKGTTYIGKTYLTELLIMKTIVSAINTKSLLNL